MKAAGEAVAATEPSDFDKFADKWNTRGGAILITVIGLFAGLGMEKFFEAVGVESTVAGIWTSCFFFVALLFWTSQYLFRVVNKSTTYAEQLASYEQEVMMRRLAELDDDEIEALCAEVGVSVKEIEEVVGDKRAALTQKEKVLELFKNSQMPVDPRASVGGGPFSA